MVVELAPNEHGRARPLLSALEDTHLAVTAILAGTVEGHVYVDDPANPTVALANTKQRYYLAGRPGNEASEEGLRQLFAEVIYPRNRAAGALMFVLYYAPGWEVRIAEGILPGKFPIRDEREYYAFRRLDPEWRSRLPAGYTLRPVDRELLAQEGLANLDALKEEMTSERETVEAFLERSFGVCLLHRDEIAGWCLSEYNSGDRCEVGIETVEGHRRRGLGTVAASAFVERALQQGVRHIGWDCWAGNVASAATARRAGFERVSRRPVHFAWFDEVDNLAVNGNVRLGAGDYAGAVEWLERALSRGEAKGWAYWVYWVAACAYARLGRSDDALGALRQAWARGFRHLEPLHSSAHLESLRGSAGWRRLMEEFGLQA